MLSIAVIGSEGGMQGRQETVPNQGGRSTGSDSIAVKVKTRKHKDVFHNFESRDSNSGTSRLVEKVVNTRLVRELS